MVGGHVESGGSEILGVELTSGKEAPKEPLALKDATQASQSTYASIYPSTIVYIE